MRFTLLIDTTLCSLGARRRVSRVFLVSVGDGLSTETTESLQYSPSSLAPAIAFFLGTGHTGAATFGMVSRSAARRATTALRIQACMLCCKGAGGGGGGRVQACFAVVWYSVCVKGVLTVSVSPNGNSGDPFELLSKRVLAAFADVGAAERP